MMDLTRALILEKDPRGILHKYAQEQDGCCKVSMKSGMVRMHPQDKELGLVFWDYYFTDEPDSFPFERYGM